MRSFSRNPEEESISDQTPDQAPGWRFAFVRNQDERMVAGLSAGIADVLEIEAVYVRAAFVSLAFAGGIGILLYAVLWVMSLDEISPERLAALKDRFAAQLPRQRLALWVLFGGVFLMLRSLGIWFGDSLAWSATFISFGFALSWSRVDPSRRSRWATQTFTGEGGNWRSVALRILAGGVFMTGGLAIYLNSVDANALVGNVALAVGMTIAGILLVFGPWVWRLVGQVGAERSERIRSDERAEMAAHLHDSVLQTLALMQRTDDPKSMSMLARQQERELRGWLYGPEPSPDGETMRSALESAAARLESAHQIPIDVVIVGDAPMDDAVRALVAAAGEAITNAARHSGANLISVFAEADDAIADVFVSDQGKGFILDGADPDRKGISESIIGRMERAGGEATITSEPGEGTEVHMSVRRT
ncbi:MAG: PspC domain-containing protein [Acidimicrobiia bacterium]|nr:PspC domain-containing protein [Acidimicrobiia bacterium]